MPLFTKLRQTPFGVSYRNDYMEEKMALRKPYEQTYYPSTPTKATLFFRKNLLYQLYRFLLLNAKMLRMVRKH